MPETVLLVDDSTILRDLMCEALKRAGYATLQAASGAQALTMIRVLTIDLVVLDIGMPEMDGLTMLGHLRATESGRSMPVLLLTAREDRGTILKASALGVRDYLLKSTFSVKDFLARVQRVLARPDETPPIAIKVEPPAEIIASPAIVAGPTGPLVAPMGNAKLGLLTGDQTRLRLAEITGTRTFAGVVSQIVAMAHSPDSGIAELVAIVESDPIIASRVLQLANSSLFRQKHSRISGVDDAVRKVGMRAIENMVISVGIFAAFPPDSADGFNTMRCWQHSFAVSAIVRALMPSQGDEEREQAALAGLCHDLGEIVLRQHFSGEYQQIVEQARATGEAVSKVEAKALGMRHGDLVTEVFTKIGLPSTLAAPIRRFHDGGDPGTGEGAQIVRILQVANQVAHGMMLAPSPESTVSPITQIEWKRACGNGEVSVDAELLRREVLIATNLLARLPAGDEARFAARMYPHRELSVWYARHSTYAQTDPLGMALALLANVRCEGRLPQQAELDGVDLIVVASPTLSTAVIDEIRILQNSAGYKDQPIVLLGPVSCGTVELAHATQLSLPVALGDLEAMIESASLQSQAVC